MKIVLDIMGGDNPPAEIIKGGEKFARETDQEVVFIGHQKTLLPELNGSRSTLKSLRRNGHRYSQNKG